ncbi:MAG TPA: hypothetical protein VGJ63_06505 [Micromonosporaceae bacterium]|jgi:hypothetical protein
MRTVVGLVRTAVRFEFALYRSLFRWVTRRPDVPPGAVAFRYVGPVAALLWVFICVSAIELMVLHLALPWEVVRLVVDILSAWGLVWMLGLIAGFRVYPHVIADSGLRVRRGVSTHLTLPWDGIAAIVVRERGRAKSGAIQLDRDGTGTVLNVVMAGRTNVDVKLRHPLVVPLRTGEESVTELRLFADDARRLVSEARGRLTASPSTAPIGYGRRTR